MRRAIVIGTALIICISVAVTFFRYIIQEDIAFESKPIDEFTEDDL